MEILLIFITAKLGEDFIEMQIESITLEKEHVHDRIVQGRGENLNNWLAETLLENWKNLFLK